MKKSVYSIPSQFVNDTSALSILYNEACEYCVMYNDEYNQAFDIKSRILREKAKKAAKLKMQYWMEARDTIWSRINNPFED